MLSEQEELEMLRLRKRKAQSSPESSISGMARKYIGEPAFGALEAATSVATAGAAGVAGLGAGIAGMALPGERGQGQEYMSKVAQAGTYQPRSEVGKTLTGAAMYIPEKISEFSQTAGEGVASMTDSPTAGAVTQATIQAAPSLLGRAAGPVVKRALAESERAAGVLGKMNSKKDAGLNAAREAGLVVSPNEAGAGIGSRTLESLSGEPKATKLASKKNQPVLNEIIQKDLGIPEDVPISRDVLAKIREEEGLKYEAVKKTGPVSADLQYKTDLRDLGRDFATAAKDFKHRKANPLTATLKGLDKPSFDAASAVEEVKLLRADADKAYRQGDKRLGSKFKGAAQVLDDLLERHMSKVGSPQSYNEYRAARTRIAKTYDADKALNDTTGNINADVYKKLKDQRKPLSGGAKTVADFASQFPKSSRRAEKMGATGPTLFDVGLAALSPKGLLADVATAGARPALRGMVTSKPYQSMFIKPSPYQSALSLRLSDAMLGPLQGAGAIDIGLLPNQRENQ